MSAITKLSPALILVFLVACSGSDGDGADAGVGTTYDSGGGGPADAGDNGPSYGPCEQLEAKFDSCGLEEVPLPGGECLPAYFATQIGDCLLGCILGATCADLEELVCGGEGSATEACGEGCFDAPFVCDDGTEIFAFYECDYEEDCPDGSDEHEDCPAPFVCDDGSELPAYYECDLYEDCPDGSDEHAGCPAPFVCDDGEEIPGAWECDSEVDCDDGSDEHDDCWYVEFCEEEPA